MRSTFPRDAPDARQAPAAPTAPTEWAERGERSNRLALRFMAWVAVTLGRSVARWLLHPITLYFLCFAPVPRRHSARYLARALGRPARWRDLYRHIYSFASTVLDRVYFVRGRLDEFSLHIAGEETMDASLAEGRGAILLGAHLGSFEALHAVGESRPGLRVAMVMYPDNARMIHSVLQAVAPDFKLGIIPIGRSGSTLAIRDWLDAGGLVGLLGDRFLQPVQPDGARSGAAGGSVMLPFLDLPARFSDGPLRLAQLLRRRVIFMVALYRGGNRYEVRFEPLADFRQAVADPVERDRRVQAALADYVTRLEALVHEAPYNWFNFFDYWGEDLAH